MAFLPVIAISRSQQVRLGRGPGARGVVPEVPSGDEAINVATGALNVLFYANLNDGNVRKDYQHHSAIGALDSVGTLSTVVTSDMYALTVAPTITNGTGLSVNVPAFTLVGRTFLGAIDVAAVTNLAFTPNSSATLARLDAVATDNAGHLFTVAGTPAAAVATEVDTLTIGAGTPTTGSLVLSFVYNGQTFTTTPLVPATTNIQVGTAIKAAANLPGAVTGSGLATLGTGGGGVVTITGTSGAYSLSNLKVVSNTLSPVVTAVFAQTTAGAAGPQAPVISGVAQALSTVVIPAGATSGTSPSTITAIIPTS